MGDEPPILEERQEGSKKLFIIFGGVAAGIAMPPFEFYQSSKILTENRVFVRDVRQAWYHAGLPGTSTDIATTRDYLQDLIARYAPQETVMVGNSMGGFAAMLFAALIGNVRAVAFAPQTFIGPRLRWKYRDRRWRKQILGTYMRSLRREKFYDLATLTDTRPWQVDIYVSASHRLDMAHADHVRSLPQVTVHEYAEGGHKLVKHLRDIGELPRILLGKTEIS